MTTEWYPRIDESKCGGCLACVEVCEREVFEEAKKKVLVKSKENCLQGCKECQKYCMIKAIYFPDDLEKMMQAGMSKCSCGEHKVK